MTWNASRDPTFAIPAGDPVLCSIARRGAALGLMKKRKERLSTKDKWALTLCRRKLGCGCIKVKAVAAMVADVLGVAVPQGKLAKYELFQQYVALPSGVLPVQEPKRERFVYRPESTDEFLSTYQWRRLRMKVIVERGARCECCGATPRDGVMINVDHIKPRRLFPELALVESNLQILCEVCNHGKGNWDQTDWRNTVDVMTDEQACRILDRSSAPRLVKKTGA